MQQHCPLYPCRLQKSHCLYPTSRPTSKKPVGMQPYCCGLLMPPVPCETGGGQLSEVVISTLLTGTWAWQHSVNSTLPAHVLEDSPAAAQPQNIPLAKNKLPLPTGQLAVRLLQAAPIQPHQLDPNSLRSGLAHPGDFPVLEECYQPKPGVNRKRPG